MPANLTPDYYAAERRFRQASSAQEKIEILREMLAIMPKHKGTEHLQGDLKKKIAKLHSQAQKKQVKSKSSGLDYVPSEGAGQVVLVGPPNSGKSSILTNLTHAHTEVAEYPYSTFKPIPGMMNFEDIQVQLVDLPPVSSSYTEVWVFNIVRLADLVLLVIDLGVEDSDQQVLEIFRLLEEHKIILQKEGERKPKGSVAVKPTLIVGTKADIGNASKRGEILRSKFGSDLPLIFCSISNQTNVEELKRAIFRGIRVIRVYTKIPGKKADSGKPYVLYSGATVMDAAVAIHKELANTMKYVRLWGINKYDGQRVERDHVLEDGDIIEIRT